MGGREAAPNPGDDRQVPYLNKPVGQRVFILSYETNGTVTVAVTAKYNKVVFERNVFGVPLDHP